MNTQNQRPRCSACERPIGTVSEIRLGMTGSICFRGIGDSQTKLCDRLKQIIALQAQSRIEVDALIAKYGAGSVVDPVDPPPTDPVFPTPPPAVPPVPVVPPTQIPGRIHESTDPSGPALPDGAFADLSHTFPAP